MSVTPGIHAKLNVRSPYNFLNQICDVYIFGRVLHN